MSLVCGYYAVNGKHFVINGHCAVCHVEMEEDMNSQHKDDGQEKERNATSKNSMPEYRAWNNMKQRCCNPNNDSYKYYGGRGIKVCDKWRQSFDAFYKDVGTKPEGHTLERLDYNGNYEPGNVMWASWAKQALNKRYKPSKHGYMGVFKNYNRWAATISKGNKNFYLGTYATIEEAAEVSRKAREERDAGIS